MNFNTVVRRLARGEVSYALGRFQAARQIYSALMRMREAKSGGDAAASAHDTVFPHLSADRAVADLSKDAVAFGFDLPAEMIADLERYAKDNFCVCTGDRSLRFHWADVSEGRLPSGRPVVMGSVENPEACVAITRLRQDPVLLDVVSRYLGYRPRTAAPRLYWSFKSDVSDAERRRRNQTIDYHFDVFGYNFVYASFYLTDVDARSGAHALVRGSHRGKPLRLLLGSASQPEEKVFAHFDRERELVIEGPKGTGFVEDTSCFHRALVPIDRERLMLQIRFS